MTSSMTILTSLAIKIGPKFFGSFYVCTMRILLQFETLLSCMTMHHIIPLQRPFNWITSEAYTYVENCNNFT